MPEVRKERTGWRDQRLSERHRRWGWDCPMVDIDFLALEYDEGKAAAIVEYKHENAAPQYASQPSYRAIIDLGDRAGVPVFAVRYADDFSWWRVIPLSCGAKKILASVQSMTEEQWVTFLYRLRGRDVPVTLFADAAVAI